MGRRNVVIFSLLAALFGTANALHLRRQEDGSSGTHRNERQYYRELQQGGVVIDVSLSTASLDLPRSANVGPVPSPVASNFDGHSLEIETGGPFVGPEVEVLLEPPMGSKNRVAVAPESTKRIIGGYDAEPHPFHSMLLLRYGGGWRWAGCGGTLVSNCHVVTAAHCAADPTKTIGAVFVNAHRPYQENGDVPFHFSEVQHVIRHAGFNATTNENDIAVIKMAQCLNITQFPPAIPTSPAMEIPSAFVADILGFGKLSEQGNMFVNVQALQKAQVPIIAQDTCKEYYGDKIKNDMFCGGFADAGGVDACQGDSGSSMTFEGENKRAFLIGVISWGIGCGRATSPGVYASVQYHYSWLARHVCGVADTNVPWCSTLLDVDPPTSSPSAAASDIEAPSSPPQSSGSSSKRSHKDRTSSGFYLSSSSTTMRAQSRMETASSAISTNTNIAASAEEQDNHAVQFWDPTSRHSGGCKLSGNQCWLGSECCSGVCRQRPRSDHRSESHAECLSLNLKTQITQRRKGTRGFRVERSEN